MKRALVIFILFAGGAEHGIFETHGDTVLSTIGVAVCLWAVMRLLWWDEWEA